VNCYFQRTIYLFVSPPINFAKIFNVHARNEHFHVNAYGTMQRSVTHNNRDTIYSVYKSKRTTVGKIKTIFPSRDHLSRSDDTSTVKLGVQLSKISLRRARARARAHAFIQYLFEAIFRAKSWHRRRDATQFLFRSRGEPSHSKLKSVESRI